MTDAFIYDHVRTPRGRGKPDGALHEVTALDLATHALAAIKDRNQLEPTLVDDVVMGCVDPIGEAGGVIPRAAALKAGYGDKVPGVQISRFCASGLDAINFAAAEVMSGQHDLTIGGGVEVHEPHRDWRIRRRLADGSVSRCPDLFHAAGRLRRSDCHQVWLFARRRRRLCGGEPEARCARVGEWVFQELGCAGHGRQRHHAAGEGRAHAAVHDHAIAGGAQSVVRYGRRARRLRRGRDPKASGD